MGFEFATATRIVFGRGAIAGIGIEAAKLGKRPLVVGGRQRDRVIPILEKLNDSSLAAVSYGVAGEPSIGDVERGVLLMRGEGCDCVIGFGGGSAIDAAKAIAAMAGNPGKLLDYLEVVGHGRALPNRSVPFIAIPTTAGTGAEVTRNAVLFSPEHKVKASLRSPGMLPTLAVVDPELTVSLPPDVTASTGMDALTQLLEAFVCLKANPMTDALCREGLARCAKSLLRTFEDGSDMAAREDMSLASMFSGLALANAGLGAVHGFAGPIGGMFSAPHGAVCAALLPHVIESNIKALQARDPRSPLLARFDEVARLLTGRISATALETVEWVERLRRRLAIPPLGQYGIQQTDISCIVENASRASSMKANPIMLKDTELKAALNKAI